MVSGWRKSTVRKTSPGMTLRLFGLFSITPTVPTAFGRSRAIASTLSITRAAPTSAFLRSFIGIAPACASSPAIAMSYQRTPCALHDADHPIFVLQDRALLDVQLEHAG